MELLCKTRGRSSAVGKSRVYFYSHPEDFDLFFEEISNDILDVFNCSIWYKKNPREYVDSDFELTIGQMQLVVMPITSRFLNDDAAICTKELDFIRKNHIPILPLLQESNILGKYDKIFKDVQFLSKFDPDATAISFKKKLEMFLSSILIKDEIASKIRSEFDASIFVSYRKKDRKYANEFIRLIHSHEDLEDVAVWYDEFLTPGENFNEEIEQSIAKCDVFSIVFTPNIVNEDNYIITTEYPIAKANKKLIFPVELVDTNVQAVSDIFEDITQLIDVHDEVVFDMALKNVLSKLNIKSTDFLPEHKYLIGLAYLSGINVEVDEEKGIKILTKCAEREYLPAIEVLVDVYSRGRGVPIDYDKAMALQSTVIKVKKKTVSFDKIERHLDYVGSLYKYANLLIELYKTDQAIEALDEAVSLLKTIDDSKVDDDVLFYYNLCYGKLAICCKIKNEPVIASKYYKEAIDLMQRFYSNNKDTVEGILAGLYNDLGTLFSSIGDYEYARDYISTALTIANRLFDTADDKETIAYALVATYSNLGSILVANNEDASECYNKAIDIFEEYLIDKRKIAYYRAAFTVCFQAGTNSMKIKEFETASRLMDKALTYIDQVLDQSSAVEDLMDKANCYSHMAQLNFSQKKYDSAVTCYERSIELLNKVLLIADFPECRRNLCRAYSNLASILMEKLIDGETDKGASSCEAPGEELYTIREYYLRGVDVMDTLLEGYLHIVKTPGNDDKVHISENMISDIESVAGIWSMLSSFDCVLIPTERAILMYSWLLKLDPGNEKYMAELRKLKERLEGF